MILKIEKNNRAFFTDISKGVSISTFLSPSESVKAWYVDDICIEPVKTETFIGEVKEGAPVNFRNIQFNPHGHGTHTECYGHISEEKVSLPSVFEGGFFYSQLISIDPDQQKEDLVLTKRHFQEKIQASDIPECLIIRTLPNENNKLTKDYSSTNPPFLTEEAMIWLVDLGIEHIIIDLPSVDREEDEGKLLAHRAFWKFPEEIRKHSTITELVFIPNSLSDGRYLCEISFPKFDNDACPSSVKLFPLQSKD
jgi:kynurenine formamidase